VTWGEGDGPGGSVSGNVIVKAANSDVISDTTSGTFSTFVSLTSELMGMRVGDAIRLTARGIFSTYGLANTIEVKVLNTTTLLTTGAQTLAANLTDRGWWIEAILVALSSGSNNQGYFTFSNTGRLWDAMDMENGADSATSILVGNLQIQVDWGAGDPANSINLRQLIVERLPNG